LEEKIKSSYNFQAPIIPHAELLTLKDYCKKVNIPLDLAMAKLKSKNIKFNENWTLKEIAKKNNLAPLDIGKIIFSPVNMGGYGYGRMTLKEICKKFNLSEKKCLEKLKRQKINASLNETLKEIALKNDLFPVDIVNFIKK